MDEQNNELQPMTSDAIISAVYSGIRNTLTQVRATVYTAVNSAMVEAYWDVGRQIEEAVGERADYGSGLMQFLSESLTTEFGKGLQSQIYVTCANFIVCSRIATHCVANCRGRIISLMRIDNDERRNFYIRECVESGWTARQLERQINSFFL